MKPPRSVQQRQEEIERMKVLEPERVGYISRGVPYAQWKANQLNALFDDHGIPGGACSSNITAATVRHGEGEKL